MDKVYTVFVSFHARDEQDAEEFVSKICDSKIVELGSLGLGTQYKINADTHLGQTLLFHTNLIHFIVFNNRDWVQ